MKGVRGRRRGEYESTFYASMEFSNKTLAFCLNYVTVVIIFNLKVL